MQGDPCEDAAGDAGGGAQSQVPTTSRGRGLPARAALTSSGGHCGSKSPKEPPAAALPTEDSPGDRPRGGKRPSPDRAVHEAVLAGLLPPLCMLMGVEPVVDGAGFHSAAAATLQRCADELTKRARHDSPPPLAKTSTSKRSRDPTLDPIAQACEDAIQAGCMDGGRPWGVMTDPIGEEGALNQYSLGMGDACWATEKDGTAGLFLVVQPLKVSRTGRVDRVSGKWCYRKTDLERMGSKITCDNKVVPLAELFAKWPAPECVEVVLVERMASYIFVSQVQRPCVLQYGPCAEPAATLGTNFSYYAAMERHRGNCVSVHLVQPSAMQLLEGAASRVRNAQTVRQMMADPIRQQVSLRTTAPMSLRTTAPMRARRPKPPAI